MLFVATMSNGKKTKNLDKLDRLLRQNPHGVRITDLAGKLGISRSTVYDYLNTLDLRGKAYYERGIAYPKRPSAKTESKSNEYIKELKEIGNVAILSPDLAWHKLSFFTACLPEPLKSKVRLVTKRVAEDKSYSDRLALKITIDAISTIIYQSFDENLE